MALCVVARRSWKARSSVCSGIVTRFTGGGFAGMHFGQPMVASHPGLMGEFDVTPGISKSEFLQRRLSLTKQLTRNGRVSAKRHVVAIASAKQLYSAPDVPCEFRQCADFRYLCGFLEPESMLLLEWTSPSDTSRATLFVSGRNEKSRLWHGPRYSLPDITDHFPVDTTMSLESLKSYLERCYPNNQSLSDCVLWYSDSSISDWEINETVKCHFRSATLGRLLPHLHLQRVTKSPAELMLMKRAATATDCGFMAMMLPSDEPVSEWELNARFVAGIGRAQAVLPSTRMQLAFPCVIAGGCRATILHYLAKDMLLDADQLVLVDAGAEADGYVCDQSRSWPLSGSFTPAQKLVYEAVLDVYQTCVESINDGASRGSRSNVTLDKLQDIAARRTDYNLRTIGLIPSSVSSSESMRVSRQLFPHALGHYVGGDVHDCKQTPTSLPLRPGITMTIEPGIYIAPDSAPSWIPSSFRGIGVRIEDTVVLDDNGQVEFLTNTIKSVTEIEEYVNR